jgi:hypothetical protein
MCNDFNSLEALKQRRQQELSAWLNALTEEQQLDLDRRLRAVLDQHPELFRSTGRRKFMPKFQWHNE